MLHMSLNYECCKGTQVVVDWALGLTEDSWHRRFLAHRDSCRTLEDAAILLRQQIFKDLILEKLLLIGDSFGG